MSPAFISGVETSFPEAHITFDRFHIMKVRNNAVDQVRREEAKTRPELAKSRYIWLKNRDKLPTSQQAARFRSRGYHSTKNLIAMISLLGLTFLLRYLHETVRNPMLTLSVPFWPSWGRCSR